MGHYLEECIILDLDIELIKMKNLFIILFLLSFSLSFSQTKTDAFFVDGVCGMCKERIENSCNLFKFNFNISESDLNTLLEKLAQENNVIGGRIRVVFFRDSEGKYLPLDHSLCFVAEIESDENIIIICADI